MALREPQGNPLLALSSTDVGNAQRMAPDLCFILQVGLGKRRISGTVLGLLLFRL